MTIPPPEPIAVLIICSSIIVVMAIGLGLACLTSFILRLIKNKKYKRDFDEI